MRLHTIKNLVESSGSSEMGDQSCQKVGATHSLSAALAEDLYYLILRSHNCTQMYIEVLAAWTVCATKLMKTDMKFFLCGDSGQVRILSFPDNSKGRVISVECLRG